MKMKIFVSMKIDSLTSYIMENLQKTKSVKNCRLLAVIVDGLNVMFLIQSMKNFLKTS